MIKAVLKFLLISLVCFLFNFCSFNSYSNGVENKKYFDNKIMVTTIPNTLYTLSDDKIKEYLKEFNEFNGFSVKYHISDGWIILDRLFWGYRSDVKLGLLSGIKNGFLTVTCFISQIPLSFVEPLSIPIYIYNDSFRNFVNEKFFHDKGINFDKFPKKFTFIMILRSLVYPYVVFLMYIIKSLFIPATIFYYVGYLISFLITLAICFSPFLLMESKEETIKEVIENEVTT